MRLSLLGSVLLLGNACQISAEFAEGHRCADGLCPSGQTCEEGVCRTNSGIDIDASVDAQPPPRACGGSVALVESFASGRAEWWLEPKGALEVGGELRLAIAAGPGERNDVYSTPRLDIVGSRWFARVQAAAGATTLIGIQGDAGGRIRHIIQNGMLLFDEDGESVSVPYDENAHQYLGFRESDGTVFWQTSADGIDFADVHSTTIKDYMDRFQAVFLVESIGDGRVATTGIIDDINGGGTATHPFCKAAERSDQFDDGDGVVSEKWSQFGNGCQSVTEEDGDLVVVTAADNACVLSATGLHDLRDSLFDVEFDSLPADAFVAITLDGDSARLQAEVRAGQLRAFDCPLVPGVCTQIAAVASNEENFWRFRGAGTNAVFEYSADGSDYTPLSALEFFDLSAVRATITITAGQTIRIERVN